MRLIAYADGASRGNPGPAAYGYLVVDEGGVELDAGGEAIGRASNNVAEYHGAIAALEAAQRCGASQLELRLDSQLIVRQFEGRYRVKHPDLRPLFQQLTELAEALEHFAVRHVSREQNGRADALANAALDDTAMGGGRRR